MDLSASLPSTGITGKSYHIPLYNLEQEHDRLNNTDQREEQLFLEGRKSYHHFMDEKTEAQIVGVTTGGRKEGNGIEWEMS